MPGRIYALLVGINDYAPPVRTLAGCRHDVDRFHDYLRRHVAPASLAVEVLQDQAATRAGIVEAFRSHLGQAGEDDVALFQFCGHGARWASDPAFKEFYPDGRDEGLVCFDSRPGGYDLADKELAVLIGEVAPRVSQMAVILDCCHSGSGTRGADALRGLIPRLTDEVTTARPLESYLGGHYARLRDAKHPLAIPTARHILLAACERGQLAQESQEPSGVFTSTLLEVLERSGGDLSYADVFARCRAAVRSRAFDQDPQFETFGRFDAGAGFLGRTTPRRHRRFTAWCDAGVWTVECGAIHGVPSAGAGAVTMALYREDDETTPTGTASVVQVGAQASELALEFDSAENTRYRAEMMSLPAPPVPVAFAGDETSREAVQALFDDDPVARVMLVAAQTPTRYALIAADGRVVLTETGRGIEIASADLTGSAPERAAAALLPPLKHVLAWERLLALQNPATKLDAAKVELVFEEERDGGGTEIHLGPDATLRCTRAGDDWRQIRGRFKVRNRTGQPLHVMLAYFSSDYGIYPQRNEPVPAGGEWMTLWGDQPMEFFYLEDGVHESFEPFRLIVSTEKVDDFLLAQEKLELGQAATRAIGTVKPPGEPFHRNEWFTRPFTVHVVRQIDQVGAADTSVAGGQIVVMGHPAVTATIHLGAARGSARGISQAPDFSRAYEAHGLRLLDFAAARGGDGLGMLELTDIRNAASLKDTPLEIALTVPLGEDEGILPVVYDGQHVLLGGTPRKEPDGSIRVTIDHLAGPSAGQRGLGDSLKLYFLKTWLKREHVNQLRWVEFRADGTIHHQASGLADKVAAATRVLLLVHGIIGDTAGMAAGVKACGLEGQFDLVLTYDYENLSTPIDATARQLKDQLRAAGFHDRDDKQLTLLVHSMGGLVSRWLIEREQGNRIVDHLVMCGTPNHGSPFGHIDEARKVLTMLTGLALNYLPALIPFSSALLFALNRSQALTPTLEQMHPASEFIRTLNHSDDPGIPYTILAGDVATWQEPGDALSGQLLGKLGQGMVFDTLFANQAHDIAVGVESILGVQGERRHPPVRRNVACHHMNYFVSQPGQQALMSVAW